MKLNNLQKRIISFNTTVVFSALMQSLLTGFVIFLEWDRPNFVYIIKTFWFIMLILFLGLAIWGTLNQLTVYNITSTLARFNEWKDVDYKKIIRQSRIEEEREIIVL